MQIAHSARSSPRAGLDNVFVVMVVIFEFEPTGNVWAWADDDLRKKEQNNDTITVFKRRVVASCDLYPCKLTLVPSLAGRMSKCVRRRGANIGT